MSDAAAALDAALAAIEAGDGELRSTPVVFAEEARAMLAAAPAGPLTGVPATLKDMFSVPWRGAHNGTRHELVAPTADGVFGRLRDAGALVVGVANQHELGMGTTGIASVYGPAGNPHDPQRCAGGSSGGSAAAVAAGFVAASVGSDSGGSTRIPAAYCGVVGLKLTWGSVPRAGYTGANTTLSAAGALARDAEACRALAQVVADRAMPAGDGAGLTVGIVSDPFWQDIDPDVERLCREAIAAAGWRTADIAIDAAALAVPATTARLTAEFLATLPAAVLADLAPVTRGMIKYASLWPSRRLVRADRIRAHLRRAVRDAFAACDVLAWPTTPTTAPRIDNPTVTLPSGLSLADPPNLRQATLANLTGVPGISIPAGIHPDGMPVGLQLLAPWGEEARLLDAAAAVEHALRP